MCIGVIDNRGRLAPCFQRATASIESMCVHEHSQDADLCAQHLREAVANELCCTECADAGHDCDVRILSAVPA